MLSRRHFLVGTLALPLACRRRRARFPHPTHGVQSGDASADSAAVWCRAAAAGRMVVEWATGDGFNHARRVDGPEVGDGSDFTGVVDLVGLPAGARVRYRCWFEGAGGAGEAVEGSLVTAPDDRRGVSFVWSGDTCGQGWGIDRAFGGFRIYDAMRRLEPDFFVHAGDLIYADAPLAPEVRIGDRVWRNLVTDAKSRPAVRLDDFRGNFAYNLLDEPLRKFAAETAIVATWDDHEVRNNWHPGTSADLGRAALARRALFEWVPFGGEARAAARLYRKIPRGPLLDVFVLDTRAHRSPNAVNLDVAPGARMLGGEQLAWLEQDLAASRALWKVIVSSTPWSLVVPDGPAQEGFAQGDPGPPRGREHELARIGSFLRARAIQNVVVLTADVHYAAAIRLDRFPGAAAQGLAPIWELVAGPLHAGTFGPNALDGSFGAEVVFERLPPAGLADLGPWDGLQSFGRISIDGGTGALTARLCGMVGEQLWETTLPPAPT